MDRIVQWSDLPKELVTQIGKRLDTSIDILRFRSVCKSWRSSIPPFNNKSPPHFHLQLPDSHTKTASKPDWRITTTLLQTKVYHLQPPLDQSNPSIKPWLVKIEEPESGKLRFLNPLSRHQIKELPITFPKDLNLLDFRIIELGKSYTFQKCVRQCTINRPYLREENKAVLLQYSALTSANDYAVLKLTRNGHLFFWKYGDENWNKVSENNCCYDDIIVYKSGFYAVDKWGTVSVINSSSNKLIKYTPPIYEGGSRKHLVVSCGDLYVVDGYLDNVKSVPRVQHDALLNRRRDLIFRNYDEDDRNYRKVLNFKVYKLDEELGWVEVKSLGDRVLFVGDDCSYFVSTKEFADFKGNCIYFKDINHDWYGNDDDEALIGSTGCGFAVFNLEDRRIDKLASFPGFSQIFWPPPTWLSVNSCPPPGC